MGTQDKVSILLVDDRPENLLAMESVLADPGYDLVKADSGEVALRCLIRHDFAVVLLDVRMPGMDGYEAATLMRSRERSKNTPIIFITASEAAPAETFKGYSAGAVDYIHKPIDPLILKSKVAVFVELFRAVEQVREQARQLTRVNAELQRENAERRQAEKQVRELNAQLEQRVRERTLQLEASNRDLQLEMVERRRVEAKYRSLVELVAAITYITGLHPDAPTFFISPHVEAVLGFSPAECESSPDFWASRLHPEDRARVLERLSQCYVTGATFRADYRMLARGGRVVWIRDQGQRLYDESGSPSYFQGVRFDITDRRLAEEELRSANEKLRALIESSPLAIYTLAIDGIVQSWNPAAETIYGWTQAEVVGGLLPFVGDEERAESDALHKRILRGEAIVGVELRRKRKDGSPVDINASLAPLHDAAGAIIGHVVIAADITEQKRMQQQFLHAQKMETIGRLAGGVAHDFNNLLTGIIGYAGFAQEALPADHPARLDIEEVVKGAARASNLTRQLLAFSRRQHLAPRAVDLNDLIGDLSKMLHRLIGEDVELRTHLAPDLGRVKADPTQIEQVLVNLAVNARDAMPSGGQLTIETTNSHLDESYVSRHGEVTPGEYVTLIVSDTGAGMTEDIKAHIFEPFFTTKEVGRGTGLGLATIYGIVKQHNGHIWVYSEVGQGTVFKIYLPRVDERLSEADSGIREPLVGGTETILLAEDEPAVRAVAVRGLRSLGYAVLEATNGFDALSMSKNEAGQIHLLVTDVVMPGMGGAELAERLSTERPDIKVLLVSGYAEHYGVGPSTADRQWASLQKPLTVEALGRKVRQVLDAPADAGTSA